MVKLKREMIDEGFKNSFQAIANTNFFLPVSKYDAVRQYNESYLDKLRKTNGDYNMTLPASMTYRRINRNDVLIFGDELVIDHSTGNIKCYPKEIFDEMSNQTVELPCQMVGDVQKSFNESVARLPVGIRKQLEAKREEMTKRFQVKPFLEVYNGQELED
jgi:hypothetical protein